MQNFFEIYTHFVSFRTLWAYVIVRTRKLSWRKHDVIHARVQHASYKPCLYTYTRTHKHTHSHVARSFGARGEWSRWPPLTKIMKSKKKILSFIECSFIWLSTWKTFWTQKIRFYNLKDLFCRTFDCAAPGRRNTFAHLRSVRTRTRTLYETWMTVRIRNMVINNRLLVVCI